MTVIIISSDSLPKEAQLAAETAKALKYRCLGREFLGEVGKRHGVSEEKLQKTLDELPSLLGVNARAHALHLAYIEEAVLSRLSEGKVVCHGLAAQLYVRGVSHVLKVRVLADSQDLIHEIMKEKGLSSAKARKALKRDETLRKRWSSDLYRMDETASSVYDLVINLSSITPDEAVERIVEASSRRKFKPMTYSVRCLKDLELASRVRVALFRLFPGAAVQADGSTVVVETAALSREKEKIAETIRRLARDIPGVDHVEVHLSNDIIRQAAESFR